MSCLNFGMGVNEPPESSATVFGIKLGTRHIRLGAPDAIDRLCVITSHNMMTQMVMCYKCPEIPETIRSSSPFFIIFVKYCMT